MVPQTIYRAVTGADAHVAAFLAAHPYDLNLMALPAMVWVAEAAGEIQVALLLKTQPYVSLDLVLAHPDQRPFMRIWRLWQLTETWLKTHGVPIVCASVYDTLVHYQTLLKRAGFEVVGSECTLEGIPVETVFAKRLLPICSDKGMEVLQ